MRDYGDTNKNFARNLKALMDKNEISFEELSIRTNVPHTSLHEYVRGIRAVRLETAKHIANFFGKTVDEMIEPPEVFNGNQN